MLVLREQQLQAFRKVAVERFEERLLAHVEKHFTAQSRRLGRAQMLVVIRHSLERGAVHGFTTERDACLYLSLTLRLGGFFDIDPQLPWAAAILSDPALSDPSLRIDCLYAEASDFLRRVIGPDAGQLRAALARLAGDPPPALAGGVLPLLCGVFPEKYEVVGEEALRLLIAQGLPAAARHGIAAGPGATLFLLFMFLLGSGVDADPQFPWAAVALAVPGSEAAARLYAAGRAELAAVLA
jgi:hypothetical protein